MVSIKIKDVNHQLDIRHAANELLEPPHPTLQST